jgi:AraC-like DNA-binding protein
MASQYQKFDFFDELAVLQADNHRQNFPLHRHDVFSLTLVRSGFETTLVRGKELLTPTGSVSLTPPGSFHANPNRNNGSYDFTTFYLSPDFLTYLNNGKTLVSQAAVIIDKPAFFSALQQWSMEQQTPESLAAILYDGVITTLRSGMPEEEVQKEENDKLAAVLHYLEANLSEKMTLEMLAKSVDFSPHHFLRWFRSMKGITPMQYVNLRRIEKARTALAEGTPLVEVAHALGFYDQSHFHRFFLRYVGVTPGAFLRGSNIVQDSGK